MKLLLPIMLVLAGCAAAPPAERHAYLLPQPVMESSGAAPGTVRLGSVLLPDYLDRKDVVLQVDELKIRAARAHQWAEPLDDGIARYLQVGIANATGMSVEVAPLTSGSADADVHVRIHRLHGTIDGQVQLIAEWSVAGAGQSRILHHAEFSRTQSADGYPALVLAHAELLGELALRIAETLPVGP